MYYVNHAICGNNYIIMIWYGMAIFTSPVAGDISPALGGRGEGSTENKVEI
jgi:hypothetical protein